MTKTISISSGRNSAKATKRKAPTSQFVLGRKAFASISAIEGIYLSDRLNADLASLASAPSDVRLRVLSRKYGKK